MKQLHWCKSFWPMHWSELNEEQRKTVLESHIFLQKKRTGEVKARMVAGSNRQRGYIDKEEASSQQLLLSLCCYHVSSTLERGAM